MCGRLQDLLGRTMDVSDVVRKQAFTVLAIKCSLHDLTAENRALLLRRCISDLPLPSPSPHKGVKCILL